MIKDFSKRYGFQPRPVTPTHDGASDALRSFVLRHLSSMARGDIHNTRTVVSKTLEYVPDPSNMTVGEIWREIEREIKFCEWFRIYDMIEEIFRYLQWVSSSGDFVAEVNRFFHDQNISWKLRTVAVDGIGLLAPEIVHCGDEEFEAAMAASMEALDSSSHQSAKKELAEAIIDLSRRPKPDLTGVIHHAIAALECLAREVCEEPGQTLGQLIKRHPDRFPAPLGDAVSKLYGFASDRGRHVTEGKLPSYKEAEFVLYIASAITTYLLK